MLGAYYPKPCKSSLQMPIYSLVRYNMCFSAVLEVLRFLPLSEIAPQPFFTNSVGGDSAMPFCPRHGLLPALFRFSILLP